MLQLDNALYAAAQVVHNFGAAATLGLPLAAMRYAASGPMLRRTYQFTLAAWMVQLVSGVSFGLVSYFIVEELPQIGGLALAALYTILLCALLSILVIAAVLLNWRAIPDRTALASLATLSAAALLSAAFLRWSS